MLRRHLSSLGFLLVLALASDSSGQERLRRPAGGARQTPPSVTTAARSSAARSKARAALTSSQAHSLVRLPYRRNFASGEAGQSPTASDAFDDVYVETTVYGGAAAPYIMAGYSRNGYGRLGHPLGLASYSFSFPYAYGRLATPYSYGVYGYPYYSFYRPSFAYSVWGWPGISPLGNFGYGGYGLPYGYYGLGGYNNPYGFGGIGFPYGRGGLGYPYGFGGFRNLGYGGAFYW
jgi:hypothetical protein